MDQRKLKLPISHKASLERVGLNGHTRQAGGDAHDQAAIPEQDSRGFETPADSKQEEATAQNGYLKKMIAP